MIKKQFFNFAIFSVIILIVDLLIYFINHGNISFGELIKMLKLLLLTGVVLVPLFLYIEKRMKK
jgi:hypothetical protein